jgi:uncharacterized protein YkwD
MKLKLFLPLFLMAAVFPALLLAQHGPNPNPKPIKIASGDDMSGLMAGLDKFLQGEADEDQPRRQQPSRARIVAEKRAIITVPSAPVSPGSPVIQQLEREAFAKINQQRAAQGLPSLLWNDEVAKVARMHSQNMANYKFFSHQGLDGRMVNDRADSVGLTKWRAIGENIAFMKGYASPVNAAVQGWLNSPSHKRNLLGQTWRESAVGVAVAPDGSYYFTQVFLERR